MTNEPTKPTLECNETDPNQITGRPTQSNGIRQAAMETNPADPTRKVHPDSVPLAGAAQPTRGDSVMPTAEPTHPEIDSVNPREGAPDRGAVGGE